MKTRIAEKKDIPAFLELLSQVREVHTKIRPDLFIEGTTKYNESEMLEILADEKRLNLVAVDDDDNVVGYAMCQIIEITDSSVIVPHTEMYIDDLCVDSTARGKHVGQLLFERVKEEAHRIGCYEMTLNVWEGNDSAKAFYDKMGMKPQKTYMEFIL